MDASIILQGRGVDALGSFSRGNALAQQVNQTRDQNALRMLNQTQGPQIMAGDPNALNALARLDPNAAMAAQQNAFAMEQQRAAVKQKAAEWAQSQRAEVVQAEAAKTEQLLKGAAYFHAQGDRAGYDAYVRQQGGDPAQYPFEMFPAIAAQAGDVLEVWKTFQPEKVEAPSMDARYKVVAGTLYDLAAEGGPKAVGQGAMQEEIIMGPDGKPIMVRGGPGTTTKFTEGQSKDNVYATRAEGALAVLDPIADNLASLQDRAANLDPTGVIRGQIQSPDFQVAQQAGQEFLQAILRKDTGAAITADEQALYGETYLPQPGDGPSVLEAKRVARSRALAAMQAGMTVDQIVAVQRGLVDAAKRAEGGATQQPATSTDLGITEDDLRYLGGQ